MVKTIDATTTDRLRRSPLYLDLSPSCARKRACMELTTICRFQRLQASTKSLLHPLFLQTKGTVLLVCQRCVDTLLFAAKHAKGMSLRYDTPIALKVEKMKMKQQQGLASEMPHHAKHHASENRKAIERSLVIAMRTQYESRRGSVVVSNFTQNNAIVLTSLTS